MNPPTVSIIIVSYNRPQVLCDTIASIFRHVEPKTAEVIVVDNASAENNVELVRRNFPEVEVIECPKNYGFGKACNAGARWAKGRFLLFVNNDILLSSNPISEMICLFEANRDVGIVGCQLWNVDGSRQPSYFRFPGLGLRFLSMTNLKSILLAIRPSLRFRRERAFVVDSVSGAFLMIPRDLFYKLGGFDESYFMYLEDVDLCFQARQYKRVSMVVNLKGVTHLGQNYEDSSNLFTFLHTNKGMIIFFRKNYGGWRLQLLSLMSIILFGFRLALSGQRTEEEKMMIKQVMKLYLDTLFEAGYGASST